MTARPLLHVTTVLGGRKWVVGGWAWWVERMERVEVGEAEVVRVGDLWQPISISHVNDCNLICK